jgi:hypothetical protein
VVVEVVHYKLDLVEVEQAAVAVEVLETAVLNLQTLLLMLAVLQVQIQDQVVVEEVQHLVVHLLEQLEVMEVQVLLFLEDRAQLHLALAQVHLQQFQLILVEIS